MSMLEMLWKFPAGLPLDTAAALRPILAAIERLPGFVPLRYDLNQHENWRAYNAELTLVDALTQRTQLVRVEGQRHNQVVLMALGKHGEQPTIIAALREHPEQIEAIEELLGDLFDQTRVEEVLVTSSRWRGSLTQREVPARESGATLGVLQAWRYSLLPAGLESRADELLDQTEEFMVTEYDDFCCWRFSTNFYVRDDAHADALHTISTL